MLRLGIFTVIVLLAVVIATSMVTGKGFTGSRARGGSMYRSSKTGYYSSRYGYSTSRMGYYGYGYGYYGSSRYGARGTAAGGPNHQSTSSLSPTANVMCRRLVIADNNTDNGHLDTYIVYNSTQFCYEEKDTDAGSKKNIPVEDLMLSRFRFNMSLLPYPQVGLLVYPDKDMVVPSVNSSFRITKLAFAKSRDNGTDVVAAVDLSTLQWEPCTLDSCQPNISGSHMGYPSSRFLEGSRVFYSAVHATWKDAVDIELRWWLSSDFSEDPNYEHVFLFPGAVKFDLLIKPLANNVTEQVGNDTIQVTPEEMLQRALGNYTDPVYLSLEALFAGPESGPGSALQYMPTKPGLEAIEYNPQSMERVVFGTAVDQANGKSAYLSFPTADNRDQLCYPFRDLVDDDSTCVKLQEKATLNKTIYCSMAAGGEASLPAECQDGFLRDGQRAVKLHWVDQGAFGNVKKPSVNFYWNHGFHDPTVAIMSAGLVQSIAVVLLLLLLALLA